MAKGEKKQEYAVKLKSKTAGKELVFRAKPNGSTGKFQSFSRYTERDPKTNALNKQSAKRGASAIHDTFDEAKSAVDAGVAIAVKAGWQQKSVSGAKDAFDLASLPKP